MKEVSRRQFLTGAGVAGLAMAGAGLTACTPSSSGGNASSVDAGGSSPVAAGATGSGTGLWINPQNYDYQQNSITDWTQTTLFSDLNIGPFTIHNRIVKSAAFQLAFIHNNPEEYINYYKRMADGGVEMIWIEYNNNIWPVTAGPGFMGDFDGYDWKGLLDALHNAGSHVGYQFGTMGSALGPLEFSTPFIGDYSTETIREWVKDIGGIGKKLQDLGFDAIELNCAGNNLHQSFLSRAHNNRTDQYGPQTIESRTLFIVECIKAIKEACGSDFVVQILIHGTEEEDEVIGNNPLFTTLEESKAMAVVFEQAGADTLHVRVGPNVMHTAQFCTDLYFAPRGMEGASGFGATFNFKRHFEGKLRAENSGVGVNLDLAAAIKNVVSIPVGCAIYNEPAQAPDLFEGYLKEGKLDFLVMNRPLCVDPQYVNKLREGRLDEIAPCTRCVHCFYDPDMNNTPGLMEHCRVSTAQFRAYSEQMPEGFDPKPGEGDKKVMVVGGGPAGMEAARIAAMRGYTVTLYEKNAALGGTLAFAEMVKGPHENLARLTNYLSRQQEVYGVTVVTSTDVDAELIKSEAPDVVLLAIGGLRAPLALTGTATTPVVDIVAGLGPDIGERVAILGSNCQAVDMAVYLTSEGKRVQIVTPDPIELFEKGHSVNMRDFIKSALNGQGVRIWPSAKVSSVGEGTLNFTGESGVVQTIECDTVVDCSDMLPNKSMLDGLSGMVTYAIGDCNVPWNIAEAITAGNLIARNI
jgi:2,4-dienoyl-CoA reductase-like NADH-dependent reductase (Old Yellow Enzyme family)/thioredoxin reductase